MDEKKAQDIRRHDQFNIVALFIICYLDIRYLLKATDLSLLGTDALGADFKGEYQLLYAVFVGYIVFDFIWIYAVPTCTVASSAVILFHHVLTACAISTPCWHPQFSWHLAAGITSEISTLFLAARRCLLKDSAAFHACNGCFYVSWLLFRMLLFPALSVFAFQEYMRYGETAQSYLSIVGLSVACQIALTAMSYWWTAEMLIKMLRPRRKEQ